MRGLHTRTIPANHHPYLRSRHVPFPNLCSPLPNPRGHLLPLEGGHRMIVRDIAQKVAMRFPNGQVRLLENPQRQLPANQFYITAAPHQLERENAKRTGSQAASRLQINCPPMLHRGPLLPAAACCVILNQVSLDKIQPYPQVVGLHWNAIGLRGNDFDQMTGRVWFKQR